MQRLDSFSRAKASDSSSAGAYLAEKCMQSEQRYRCQISAAMFAEASKNEENMEIIFLFGVFGAGGVLVGLMLKYFPIRFLRGVL